MSENTTFDLRNVLSHPITDYPLLLAHCDGTRVKSDKSTLLKKLETLQNDSVREVEHPRRFVTIYDGGLVLHLVLSQTNIGASYASVARRILSTICSEGMATDVHLCLDTYKDSSIKDSERKLRGAVDTPTLQQVQSKLYARVVKS